MSSVLLTSGALSDPVFINTVAQIVQHGYSSGHSFRIGAATAAAAAGVPTHVIKILGCWSSEAYFLYIRTPRETLAAISRQISL